MINAILLLTVRNFFRNLSYSVITISGLVVGLTTAILIFLWVTYELSYDRQDPDNERVFTVMSNEVVEGQVVTQEETPVPLMDFFLHGVPEIEAVTRIDNSSGNFTYDEKSLQKSGVYADSGYFKVFKPKIISGNAAHLFPDNRSIVVSEGLAKLIFGDRDALGKMVKLGKTDEFKVTGVYEQFPDNNSMDYIEFVVPYNARPREPDEWQNYYVKLNDASSKEAVEKKIDAKFGEFFSNERNTSLLFCLTDWRLRWNFENGKVSGGRIVYVYIFSLSAIVILFMACVNYMNISTARAAKRAREIGVRKMTGATQKVLVRQFMMESLVFTFAATAISILLVYLFAPVFSQMMRVKLSVPLSHPILLPGLFGIALFTGVLAGSYPAFLLSSLKPAIVLKGNVYSGLTGAGLRRALVVFQFTLSIVLIFSAVVMWQQTQYLLKKDLGYDRKNVINVWLPDTRNLPLENIKSELVSHAGIVSASCAGASPMEVNGYTEVDWPGKADKSPMNLYGVTVDADFLTSLNFELVAGRNFSKEMIADSSKFIINERAAEKMGFASPIGQRIRYSMYGNQEGEIIGMIKNFHNQDIHVQVDPVVFVLSKKADLRNLFVRYEEGKVEEATQLVKKIFERYQPGIPVSYTFLDRDFEDQFYREKLLGNISMWFTMVAVLIACLGLFGLTMFNAQRRRKEIGIRKVLGASVQQVVVLLCRDFLRPVTLSFVFAFPIAYYLMEWFLQGYAFRIDISTLSFATVGMMMMTLVLITVSYQSFQAATQNPVESLKTD